MPRMHWHPKTGEMRIIGDEFEAPDGWLDHHPDDPAHQASAPPKKRRDDDLSREEVIDYLKSGGIAFKLDVPDDQLRSTLRDAFIAVLKARKVAAQPDATLRDLAKLVTGK